MIGCHFSVCGTICIIAVARVISQTASGVHPNRVLPADHRDTGIEVGGKTRDGDIICRVPVIGQVKLEFDLDMVIGPTTALRSISFFIAGVLELPATPDQIAVEITIIYVFNICQRGTNQGRGARKETQCITIAEKLIQLHEAPVVQAVVSQVPIICKVQIGTHRSIDERTDPEWSGSYQSWRCF